MKQSLEKELRNIVQYVKEETGFNVTTKYRSRDTEFMMALYLFYILSKEFTRATFSDMGEIVGRSRASVLQGFRNNKARAKDYYKKAYLAFNPFKTHVTRISNPFSPTISLLFDAKEQLEIDMAKVAKEQEEVMDYMFTKVKNEKVYEILKMVSKLNSSQLDIILERLPPIIKMA